MNNEKSKIIEKLSGDTNIYPGGVPTDPSDPKYPSELKVIDTKYEPKIIEQKTVIEKLINTPDIDPEVKKQAQLIIQSKPVDNLPSASPLPTTTPIEPVVGKPPEPVQSVTQVDQGPVNTNPAPLLDRAMSMVNMTGLPPAARAIAQGVMSTISPTPASTNLSSEVSNLSSENKLLNNVVPTTPTPTVISTNNVQNTNTTSFTPVKTTPRGGTSSIERKQDMITSW